MNKTQLIDVIADKLTCPKHELKLPWNLPWLQLH